MSNVDNDYMKVAEKLYYEVNPETRMCVPNSAYITTEKWSKEWTAITKREGITLYDWIKLNKQPKTNKPCYQKKKQ